ncbi:MAG: hypothetical protein NZM25_03295 [Leptospiraceae bacterium]|nr:hypothetical protein [Leptospiraceae bacterium]MDW8306012.1 hypothetical protein [Leptospiraceae bacterium]
MTYPKLIQLAEKGEVKFFLQFGGQGSPYFKELSAYFQQENMQNFFAHSLEAINAVIKRTEGTPALPFPLKIEEWLSGKEEPPSDDELAAAGISLGMIQVTQLAHLEYLHQAGIKRNLLVKHSLAASGHSQGLITACLVALNLDDNSYYDAMKIFIQYLFLMGIRAQEVFPYLRPTEEERHLSEKLGLKNPAPMVAVLGGTHDLVEQLVFDFNSTANSNIYVSLYNTPQNRIISGTRWALLKFYEKYQNLFQEKNLKYIFLRSTGAFHSPIMKPIEKPMAQDIEAISFHFKGSDLKIPVFSFADGKNLQEEENLGMRLCQDLMIRPLYWEKALIPAVREKRITHILDFGPGKTSQRLTQETLEALGAPKTVLALAVAKELKEFLAT